MVKIRPFQPSDATRASHILTAAFKGFLRDHFNAIDAAHFSPKELIKTAFVKDRFGLSRIFVADDQGNVVGVVRVTARTNGLGVFDYVGIDPDCQTKGIGSMLMAHAEKFWIQHKQRKIDTCVAAHNKKAIGYYLKHGFIPEGYRKDHFRSGVDEIILGRFLQK